jgi:hypothetical protein
MYDIYLNSENTIQSFKEFEESMLKICNEHHKKGSALAFAFILYNFENPHLRKILKDDEYWQALHSLSGEYLTVFSLNYKKPRQSYYKRRSSNGNDMQYLTTINTKLDPSEGTNTLLSRYFGDLEVKYPSILFFQVGDDNVTDTLLIDLNEETIELGFFELKTYIKSAVDALKKIELEYRNNISEIFDNLEENVRSVRTMYKVKRVTKNAGGLIGLISSIKGLF